MLHEEPEEEDDMVEVVKVLERELLEELLLKVEQGRPRGRSLV